MTDHVVIAAIIAVLVIGAAFIFMRDRTSDGPKLRKRTKRRYEDATDPTIHHPREDVLHDPRVKGREAQTVSDQKYAAASQVWRDLREREDRLAEANRKWVDRGRTKEKDRTDGR